VASGEARWMVPAVGANDVAAVSEIPEMVERIAKTLAEYGKQSPWWNSLSRQSKDRFRGQARAAIEAMREPTEEMWDAGADAAEHNQGPWEAMIDAALGEDEDGKTVQN